MALTSSGQISIGDVANNKSQSLSDISFKTLSENFADNAAVISGSRSTDLDTAPYSLSEFYAAHYPNTYFDSVTNKLTDGTTLGAATTATSYVDSESARIFWKINDNQGGTQSYVVNLIKISDSSTVGTATKDSSATGGTYVYQDVSIGNQTEDLAGGAYYSQVKVGSYQSAQGNNVDHYNQLGTITIANPGSPSHTMTTAASTQAITQAYATSSATFGPTAITDRAWAFARDGAVPADSTTDPSPTTSDTATQAVTYTGPGVYTATLTVYGQPSNARNNSTATAISHTIEYADAVTINSISSVNEGSTVTVAGTAKGFSTGVTRGLVASTATTTFIATKSSDDTSDSRYASDSHTTPFSVPSQTNTTGVYQGRVVDRDTGTVSANTSNFNVYPSISDVFTGDAIDVSADPVIVGANTDLSVGNITDNITGYTWSMPSGTGTMTSNNVSGGGSGGPSTLIIDETSAASNTVSFSTAEASKTLRLTLQGRLLQTATADKTISVELADAVTVESDSYALNKGGTITISGSHAGFASGVRFGMTTDGGEVFDDISDPASTDDATDSRYVSDAYSGTFTVPDVTSTTTAYDAYAIGIGTSEDARSSNITVYPLLSDLFTAGDVTGGGTVYRSSTTPVSESLASKKMTFAFANDVADSITGYTYAMTSGTGDFHQTNSSGGTQTADSGTGTAVIDLTDQDDNVTTFTAVGSKTITIHTAGKLSQRPSVTKSVTVNHLPEFQALTITSGNSDVVPGSALTWTVVYNGFPATGVEPITIKTVNSSDDSDIASFDFPEVLGADIPATDQLQTSQEITSADVSSTLAVPGTNGLTWYLTAARSGITSRNSTYPATNLSTHQATVYVDDDALGLGPAAYNSYLDASDDKERAGWLRSDTVYWGSTTGDSNMSIGSALKDASNLSSEWAFVTGCNNGTTTPMYINVGRTTIKQINASKVVLNTMSSQPPTNHSVTHAGGIGGITVTGTGGDTTVARHWRINHATNATFTAGSTNVDVAEGTHDSNEGFSSGVSLSAGTYYVRVALKNADRQSGWVTSYGPYTVDTYTKLLIHSDTTDTNTTFDDSSSSDHTITAVADAQHKTAQKKIGATSMYFDGTGDYLTVTDHADFDWGTGDFTIDFWAKADVANTNLNWISRANTSTGHSTWFFRIENSSTVTFANAPTETQNQYSHTVGTTAWKHYAAVRSSGTTTIYVNGTSIGSFSDTNNYSTNGGNIYVGARQYSSAITQNYNGYIDEVRVSAGIARWPSNFTVSSGQTVYDPVTIVAKMGGTSYATNHDQTSQAGLAASTIYEGPVNEADLFESNLTGPGDHMYQLFQVRGGIPGSSTVKLTLSETFDVFSNSYYRYEVNVDDQTHAWATYSGSPWKTADSTGITIDDADGINIFVALRGTTSAVVSDTDVMTLKCIWEQDTSVYATYQFVGLVGAAP